MAADSTLIKIPERDCQNCKSRRIPCDRKTPTCRKCISRNLNCPGYGVHLRWGQGVASRGKLAGKAEPVLRETRMSQSQSQCPSDSGISAHHLPSPTSALNLPFNALTDQLLNHFNRAVATRLAWVDDLRNPWRSVILPLSHYSSTVRHSVLALASKDLATRYPTDHPWTQRLHAISARHQNTTLSWLSRGMRTLRQTPNPAKGTDQARCIRAAALILYNIELFTAPSRQWQLHMQCAREIIQWKTQSASSALYTNVADVFLLYEYYFTSVFVGLTTSHPVDDLQDNIPTNNITPFSDFVRIIHTVTRAERQAHLSQPTSQTTPIENIILEIDAAKTKMIQHSQTIQFKSAPEHHDFNRLINMFYHATLIYAHRVLSTTPTAEECIRASQNTLLAHVPRLSRSAAVAQDLVWPVFITGSESRGNAQMQGIVEEAMLNVIRVSGRLDRARVLTFLRSFWSVHLRDGVTWFRHARDMAVEFGSLVII
ncbi:fungal-specific transcription factor domain-containing protein [Aspergillus avenaceus]|uniref:Fungal-specific transcription factor domain-containing protein n=1 Tax=Aspergillus avenaceus TaxID=36643 RepID=A0A5N6TPM8_ASPAV|nr:fungal-specific transcription factor domain-containing protein [Aspergillus avenaceus]